VAEVAVGGLEVEVDVEGEGDGEGKDENPLLLVSNEDD